MTQVASFALGVELISIFLFRRRSTLMDKLPALVCEVLPAFSPNEAPYGERVVQCGYAISDYR